jgi:hypothetical protein
MGIKNSRVSKIWAWPIHRPFRWRCKVRSEVGTCSQGDDMMPESLAGWIALSVTIDLVLEMETSANYNE